MRSIRSRLIFFKGQRDQFDHGRLMRANRSRRSLKKIEEPRLAGAIWSFGINREESQKQRLTRAIWSFWSFSKIDESDRSYWSFDLRSFDLCNLFQRSTREIQSRSIFFKDQKDRKIEDQQIKFPNLDYCTRTHFFISYYLKIH